MADRDTKRYLTLWGWFLSLVFLMGETVQTIIILKALGAISWSWWLLLLAVVGLPIGMIVLMAVGVVVVGIAGVVMVWIGNKLGGDEGDEIPPDVH